MNFLPFPDIEAFHNIAKAVSKYPFLASGPVVYRGKIKLHGSNASVRIGNGEIVAQSRSQIVTPEKDNAGFAKWVEERKDFFLLASSSIGTTIFGEWCGKGVMKGTAINQIPNKIFAIFAIQKGEGDDAVIITEPADIVLLLGTLPSDIFILPWEGNAFTADFTNRDSLLKIVDDLNAVIQKIEPCDPWVKSTFGIEGTAEGIVYVPGGGKEVPRKYYSDLIFKAKGEKHKVVKTKQSVQIDPEVAANVTEFVKLFATEARFEQGLAAIGGNIEMKNIGPFLKWLGSDVFKESHDELEASELEWHDVDKSVTNAARKWFIGKYYAILMAVDESEQMF